MAGWLVRHYRDRDPRRCALFEGIQAGIAVLALGLAHKDYFVVHIPYQTLVYLLIGYVASAWLQVVRSQGSAHVRWRV
jgi:F0F1-type ATP synthase assembly protein I